MKIVLIDYDYPEFLTWLYDQNPGLAEQPYDEQSRVRAESLFGVADFYSANLRKLGYEALDIHANNAIIQEAWVAGDDAGPDGAASVPMSHRLSGSVLHLLAKGARGPIKTLRPISRPLVRPLHRRQRSRLNDILRDQIQHYDPDVVVNHHIAGVGGSTLRDMIGPTKVLVGQIASRIPEDGDFDAFDLMLSCLPHFVGYFRKLGLQAQLQRLAFEPRVHTRLNRVKPGFPR